MSSSDATFEETQLANRLLEMVNASWMAQAACVAARLGLADLLENGPRSSADLAQATQCHEHSLHQLLRGLCAMGVCVERDDKFAITPMGRLLGSHARYSLKSWTTYWGTSAWPVWAELFETIKTGVGARARRTGKEGFEHLQRDRETAQIFNQAMVELTRLVAPQAARAYDFSNKLVADIGGGYGELLAAILEAHPTATGILFDMEHAIAQAQRAFTERGLAQRCQFIAGDFFASAPADADVYVLKSVIHDWNDERGRIILQRCREAMKPTARLLLLERVLSDRVEATPEHRIMARSDLHMLASFAAQERTERDYRNLLQSAGLQVISSKPVGAYCLIEAVRDK